MQTRACLVVAAALKLMLAILSQVLPVMRCGAVDAAPAAFMHFAVTAAEMKRGGHARATLACLPVTTWMHMPSASRLCEFVTLHIDPAGRPQYRSSCPSSERTPTRPASFVIYTPRVCVISAIPAPSVPHAAFDGQRTAYAALTATLSDGGEDILCAVASQHPPPMSRIKDAVHRLGIYAKPALQAEIPRGELQSGCKVQLTLDSVELGMVARQECGGMVLQTFASLPGRGTWPHSQKRYVVCIH
jgi:hypothetical protein